MPSRNIGQVYNNSGIIIAMNKGSVNPHETGVYFPAIFKLTLGTIIKKNTIPVDIPFYVPL